MDAIADVRQAIRLADRGKAKEAQEALGPLWEDARRHGGPVERLGVLLASAD